MTAASAQQLNDGLARIKVVGVGGGGCNAVARMLTDPVDGVNYFCINTDAQALERTKAPNSMRIGNQVTKGLGSGGNPEKGRQAAEESRDEIGEMVRDTEMVFVAAGMGGGTGTGAAPVVAEVSRSQGALTIGVVTRPFTWEGAHRRKRAEEGISRLREKVDTLLVIPNDALLSVCDRKTTVLNSFKVADEVLRRAVQAIAEIVTVCGDINRDFADVRAVMENRGSAMLGIGWGDGDNRATDAARAAIANPLLDVSIEGAKGVLYIITGGPDLTMSEVNAASEIIQKAVHPEAEIFFGLNTDNRLENQVKITLIATGFPSEQSTAIADPETIGRLMRDPGEAATARTQEDLDVPPFLRRQPARHEDRLPQMHGKLPVGF